ncbi:hypothetical protein [Exiguobacterium sp. s78]|uniref:hypothetical protein n=1 Tax=Exiguobacterium sp. s78 TaxID=2751197 RepID=UPI001BE69715|nr:hypothetical protein [Exiguobacterium sp. s78]
MDQDMITYDGFEAAIVGTGVRSGFDDVLIYSFDKMVEVLVGRDGMEEDEAAEFIDYNIVGAHLGANTPVILKFDGDHLVE